MSGKSESYHDGMIAGLRIALAILLEEADGWNEKFEALRSDEDKVTAKLALEGEIDDSSREVRAIPDYAAGEALRLWEQRIEEVLDLLSVAKEPARCERHGEFSHRPGRRRE